MKLADLKSCLQGIYPSTFYTCSLDGTPNVNYISHIHYLDDYHVAISGQFLNKSRKNLAENRKATAMLINPVSVCHIELELYWIESQKSGTIFNIINERIMAIHSQMGSPGEFCLDSVEIFEVKKITVPDEFHHLLTTENGAQPFSLINLQNAIAQIQSAKNLDELYDQILQSLDSAFGFKHSLLLIPEAETDKLITINTHGFNLNGVGAEIKVGEGIIGNVAKSKKTMAFMGLKREFIYAQTALHKWDSHNKEKFFSEAIQLPKLTNAASIIVVPLLNRDKLIGVIEVQSLASLDFKESDEALMMTFGSYVAMAIEYLQLCSESEPLLNDDPVSFIQKPADSNRINVTYYVEDECIFIDGEYLIRNIPAKILWRLLHAHLAEGKNEFSNRELRMDKSLQLPDYKDNLETRLILLRKRLEAKNNGISIVPSGRGKFKLVVRGQLVLDTLN